MPRSGGIGEKIYDDVEKLVAQGMNRPEAFAKISADSGRRAGTVAANYYRVARKRAGGSLRPRARRGGPAGRKTSATATARKGARRGRRAAATAGADIDALAKSLVDSVQALAEAVKSQAAQGSESRKKPDGG